MLPRLSIHKTVWNVCFNLSALAKGKASQHTFSDACFSDVWPHSTHSQMHGRTPRSASPSGTDAHRSEAVQEHKDPREIYFTSSATVLGCAALALLGFAAVQQAWRAPVRLRHFVLMHSRARCTGAPRSTAALSRVHLKSGRASTFGRICKGPDLDAYCKLSQCKRQE